MISVVNKYKHIPNSNSIDINIGRGSPLGNPFSHLPSSLAEYRVNSREEAIHRYETYLELARRNLVEVKLMLDYIIIQELADKNINLVCFWMRVACHGYVIK